METKDLPGDPDAALGETPEPLIQEELQTAVSLLIPILFQRNGQEEESLSPARKREIAELTTIGQMPHLAQDTANADLLREHFEKLQMQACRLLYHGTSILQKEMGTPQHRLSLIQNLIIMLKLIFDLKQRSFCYLPQMTAQIAPLFQLLEEVAQNPQMALSDLVQKALPLLYQINLQLRAFTSTPDKVRTGTRKRAKRAARAASIPTRPEARRGGKWS